MSGGGQALLSAYGAIPFSPSIISGLKLWLKADALVLSNDDPVATWTDASGTSNDATQATSGQRPVFKTGIVNGLPVVRFDGVDDNLAFPNDPGSSTTTFVVGAIKTAAASLPAYANFITSNTFLRISAKIGTGNNWGTFTNAFADLDSGETLVIDTFSDLEITVLSGASTILYRNGVQKAAVANPAIGSGTGNQIGMDNASRWLNCDIAEIIIYDTVLSDSNRILVEGYLAAKYAI